MRVVVSALLNTLVLFCSCAATTPAAEAGDDIVGTWTLLSTDFSGSKGPLQDPLFGPNPHGLIIYDRSGWMSVQIYTANRPTMLEPASRTAGTVTPEEAKTKALAMDSYYAYFGTWDYDAAKSTVTHHVKSSLLPYEIGRDLTRSVSLDGNHLTLTVHLKTNGETRQRVLKWERIGAVSR